MGHRAGGPAQGEVVSAAVSLPPVVKVCACGAAFTAKAWAELPLCGVLPDAGPNGEEAEMRNCACGSTIAVLVEEVR